MAQQPQAPSRALTLRQPWAWCVTGLPNPKRVENRTWAPPGDWRGPLALHTAATVDTAALAALERDWGPAAPARDQLVTGAVVAVADLAEVHRAGAPGCGWRCIGWGGDDHRIFHWVLGEVTVLPEPVPCKGRLQLWRLDAATAAAVAAGLAAAGAR